MGRANASTELSPLTGILDLRSPPDTMPAGSMRWRLNFRAIDQNKLRRAQGFQKLMSDATVFCNQDLHDQLLFLNFNLGYDIVRHPATLLLEAESSRKQRYLFAATQETVYALNNTTGNWRILGDGYGKHVNDGNGPRFKAAVQGDYVILTNDYNAPMYHILEQGYPDTPPLIQEIPDLAAIGLTKAKHVWAWKNVVFLADVEMDQTRVPFRLVWSNFDDPLSFDPEKVETIAGFKDLNANETILGGLPIGNVFLIYTNHGIWEMSVVGGEASFAFREAYQGHRTNFVGVLKYPNTLVDIGSHHVYVGDAGTDELGNKGLRLFYFNPFQAEPESPEWLHRGSKKMMDDIDPDACESHVGWLNGREVYISYATTAAENKCPDWTFRFHADYHVVDYMDYGFTAYCEFTPGSSPTIRDFILTNEICSREELNDLGYLYTKEGMPCQEEGSTAEFTPVSIHTSDPLHLGGSITVAFAGTSAANGDYTWNPFTDRYEKANGYYISRSYPGRVWQLFDDGDVLLYSNPITVEGEWSTVETGDSPAPTIVLGDDVITVEDYFKSESDEDSLCALLGDTRLDDICRTCPQPRLFIAASSEDYCLKQMNTVMYREVCTNPEDEGSAGDLGYMVSTGIYEQRGYDSIQRFASLYNKDGEVIMERFGLNYLIQPQDPVAHVKLRIGLSAQAADANTDNCGIVWHQRSTQELRCITEKTGAQHLTDKTKPYQTMSWKFWHTSRYIHVEMKIEGTGADVEFSGVAGLVSLKGVKNA